ncbi:hypothetical protein D3C87_1640670 [compost metagenome]
MFDLSLIDGKMTCRARLLIIQQSASMRPSHPRLFEESKIITVMNDPHEIGLVELHFVAMNKH